MEKIINSNTKVFDKSYVYRFFWEFLTNTISYLSLFLPILIIENKNLSTDISLLIDFLFISLFLNLILSLKKMRFFKFFGGMLPVFFVLAGIFIINDTSIFFNLSEFLIIFFAYSFVNSIVNELFEYSEANPLRMAILYILKKINKVAWVAVFYFQFPLLEVFNFNDLNLNLFKNIDFNLFLGINALSFMIEVFSAILLLFYRITALQVVGLKLKKISSWSIDDKIIEDRLLKNKGILQYGVRTVMFGDVRGFTSFSEANEIKTVAQIMRGFYKIVERKIKKYRGFKPEFIADEFVTFFSSTKMAMMCASEINFEANNFLKKFNLSMGIGVHKGKILEGLLGSDNSKKYTILGKVVNTAARLQANAQGGQILVSKDIQKAIPNALYRPISGIILKGVDPNFQILEFRGFNNSKINV